MQLFGEVVEGSLVIYHPEKLKKIEGERVILNVHPLSDKTSEGQLNLLKMWLRVISEATGREFGKLYCDIAFANMIDSKIGNLKKEETMKILRDLEYIAVDLELDIPYPKSWDRIIPGD